MNDWNVIATVQERRFKAACKLLEPLGEVRHTRYYNVLAMKVADIREFVETLRDWLTNYPDSLDSISRVGPVETVFHFQSPEEFESRGKEAVGVYLPQLARKSFHVRMHRRGWKGRLATPAEEQLLGEYLYEQLGAADAPGRIDFNDPDAILGLETLDTRAGVALWTREDLSRYPFLKLD